MRDTAPLDRGRPRPHLRKRSRVSGRTAHPGRIHPPVPPQPRYKAGMTEDDLIARYFAPIAGPGALGLRDDAALLTPPPGCDLVLTKDAVVAGVHFFAEDPPASVARKALRVNVSDLAAKGADPQGFLLALAMPAVLPADWLASFAGALGEDAKRYGIPLLGGDTVQTPGPLMLSVTALGSVPHGRMVPRTGARPGDRIYVSGTIGDAALGLKLRLQAELGSGLTAPQRAHLLARYLEPQPRLALRHALRDHARGAMDVSDGLVGDLTKMMRASGAGCRVRLSDVPLSDAARALVAAEPLFDTAATGGDDYELLASVAPAEAAAFEAAANAEGETVTYIGDVVPEEHGCVFLGHDHAPRTFARGSYSHF
jgi:thiamine-monophosphate kinase